MKIACLQLSTAFCCPEENYAHLYRLVQDAMQDSPDVLVLPETWNTGFFPNQNLEDMCDRDGQQTKEKIGALAKQYKVNIVAGSVTNLREGKVYNTAMIFDRAGNCIASYDKTHLFSPMGEHKRFTPGDHLATFLLDGVKCGILICYDLRFPELTRSMTVPGLDMLFVVSQWPKARTFHLRSLVVARAIENQMFVVCCNSCGTSGKMVCGGNSSVVDPMGQTLVLAGDTEQIIYADCALEALEKIRSTIPVFQDRRPELYHF